MSAAEVFLRVCGVEGHILCCGVLGQQYHGQGQRQAKQNNQKGRLSLGVKLDTVDFYSDLECYLYVCLPFMCAAGTLSFPLGINKGVILSYLAFLFAYNNLLNF